MLRKVPELIPSITREAHQKPLGLHRFIEQVPLPDDYMLQRIKREFYPIRGDTIGTLSNLQHAATLAQEHRYVSDLAFRMGELFIESLEAQKPFIIAGSRDEAA